MIAPGAFIATDVVQAALDGLLYASAPPAPSPLRSLLQVEERVLTPDFPATPHARELALQQCLVDHITDAFNQHRLAFGLELASLPATVGEALAQLDRESVLGSPELKAWSVLYQRYVLVTLNLSPDQLGSVYHADPRTLRRYQQHGIRRLTERLIQAEREARWRLRHRRLTQALPVPFSPLVGRDTELALLRGWLEAGSPRHAAITGPVGIGKTALASALLYGELDRGHFEQLVWCAGTTVPEQVFQKVVETCIPPGSSLPLGDYLQVVPTMVVIDDAEPLANDPGALDELLSQLRFARVILITSLQMPLMTDLLHQRLSDLTLPDVATLLVAALRTRSSDPEWLAGEMVSSIWAAVGGNPLAIKLLAHNASLLNGLLSDTSDVVNRLYALAYASLTLEEQAAWFHLSLMPEEIVHLSELQRLGLSDLNPFLVLSQRHLVEPVQGQTQTLRLTAAARTFLASTYRHDPEARRMVGAMVESLGHQFTHQPFLSHRLMPIIEHLLVQDWLTISGEQRRAWLRAAWVSGAMARRSSSLWRRILEQEQIPQDEADIELQIAYAVCLRRLGEWDEAAVGFQRAQVAAGRSGQFLAQAYALLEFSVLLRYRGEYEQADRGLAQAERAAVRFRDETLRQATLLERAQVAVEVDDGALALQWLAECTDSLRARTLQSEAYLLLGDLDGALREYERALDMATPDDVLTGRLHTLRGRVAQAAGDWVTARYYFTLSLERFESLEDVFALARARTNLAAVLIPLGELGEAADLLGEAEAVQRRLGDQVALATTEHNLRLLHARMSERLWPGPDTSER